MLLVDCVSLTLRAGLVTIIWITDLLRLASGSTVFFFLPCRARHDSSEGRLFWKTTKWSQNREGKPKQETQHKHKNKTPKHKQNKQTKTPQKPSKRVRSPRVRQWNVITSPSQSLSGVLHDEIVVPIPLHWVSHTSRSISAKVASSTVGMVRSVWSPSSGCFNW